MTTLKDDLRAIYESLEQHTGEEVADLLIQVRTLAARLVKEKEEVPADILEVLESDNRRTVLLGFLSCIIKGYG